LTRNLHDFAVHMANALPRLTALAAGAPRQHPSELETYVLGRIGGTAASPLLDLMPLAAAVRLCVTAGAVVLFGPKVDLNRLTDSERHVAGGRGFQEIAGGAQALRTFLDDLKQAVGPRTRLDGPDAAFGKLQRLLWATRNDPGFESVRNIAREYILNNFALDGARIVFGNPMGRRKLHSIRTLELEMSVRPKRLRKHLRAAGLITEAQMTMSDNKVTFDAEAGLKIAKELREMLSLADATEYLNVPRSQMGVLVKHGFVQPCRRVAAFGGQDGYAIADLDAFLAALRRKAQPAGRDKCRRLENIPGAARRTCCSAADVVRLILESRVPTWVRQRASWGYLGLLVNPGDVARAIQGPQNGGLPLRKAAKLLATHDRVVASLINGKHLASYRALNPINGYPQTLVAPKEVKRFKTKYVSLHALANERKIHILAMKNRLHAAGVKPAIDRMKVGATFYHRDQVTGRGPTNEDPR
jgi:hypothetical protein